NWELSSDRANAVRRFLGANLVEPQRVARVVGLADKELLLPKEPLSPRNRRISVTLLRGTQTVAPTAAPAGRDLLSVPDVDTKQIAPQPQPAAPAAPAAPAPKPGAANTPPASPMDTLFHNASATQTQTW